MLLKYFTWSGGECGSCSSLDGETFEEGSEPGSQHINCHCSLTETDKNGKPLKKSNGQEQENPQTKEPAPYIYRAKEELENRLISTKYQAVDSTHPKPHTGVDIRAPEGTPIKAVRDGVVVKVSPQLKDGKLYGYGNYIKIKNSDDTYSYYAHMIEESFLSVDDQIEKGNVIGYVGSTGSSTGNHLHYTLKNKDDIEVLQPTDEDMNYLLNYFGTYLR